jgi:hypothetical protein
MSVPKEVRAKRLCQVIVGKSQNNFGDQVEKYSETKQKGFYSLFFRFLQIAALRNQAV